MDSKDKAFLNAKLYDAVKQCENKSVFKFVGFLDASGCAVAQSVSKKTALNTMLWGGYSNAERVVFGVFPDWCEASAEQFPIIRLKVHNKSNRTLSHRDVLGALMSAGIERDTVGDILISDNDPVVFVLQSVAEHIKAHITKIASAGVEITEDISGELSYSPKTEDMSGTVASMRLDCVVAEFCNASRQRAAVLIESGMVAVNSLEVLKLTYEVKAQDVISVRRVGKFSVEECDRLTKKGRIALKYKKYI